MLMCDKKGIVEGSVPGMARAAVVTREQCEDALAVLSAPDPDSRTKDFDGRRIEAIDGGWRLLNHDTYKKKLGLLTTSSKERVKRYRERQSDNVTKSNALPNVTVTECNHQDQDQDLNQEQKEEKKEEPRAIAPSSSVQKPELKKKTKLDSIDLPLHIRAQEAVNNGTQPGHRPDVIQLHSAWKSALGIASVLRSACSQDAFHLADAIDSHGLQSALLVAKYSPLDGMVSGAADPIKTKHQTIGYIFGNEGTFSRILTEAKKKEPVPGAPTQLSQLNNAYNQGRR